MQAVGSKLMNMRGALTAMTRIQIVRTMAACATTASESERSVFISQSTDIHTNLALEDWLYKNTPFENHHVLLLWRSDPSVVIGRHQNLWAEVDVKKASENGISIARRNSGGGSVYHDHGNLNCTFFTPRDSYCREKNLEVVARALSRDFGIDVQITPRHDITLGAGKQISGTASKLGENLENAYHHLTLLVDANLESFSSLLNPNISRQDSEPSKPPMKELDGKPSHEQVLYVYEVLRDNLPKLFVQPMNYKIYSDNLLFVNNILNKTTIGIIKYIQQAALLRTVGHLKFAYVKFEVLNMSHDVGEGRVTVRWRIVGLSGFRVMLKFWKFKLWKWQEIMKQQETWYDGISYFDIGADGRIYRHIADKVMVDKNKEVADEKEIKGALAAKLAVLATLIPRVNNSGDGLGFQCSYEEPTSSTLSDLLLTGLL